MVKSKLKGVLKECNPELLSGSLGFVSYAPDTDYQEPLRVLQSTLPLLCVGGTSLGDPFDTGDDVFSASAAFTAVPGLRHATSISHPLNLEHAASQMADVYGDCLEKLGSRPKLLLAFLPMLGDLFVDDFLAALFSLAGDVPVFGGVVSDDDLRSGRSAVFHGGVAYPDRLLLVGLAGDISPVFGIGYDFAVPSDYSPVVTAAKGNIVVSVDDMPFAAYMRKLGFGPEEVNEFPISIQLRDPDAAAGSIPRAVALTRLDSATGAGVFSEAVPTGIGISPGFLNRDNIARSTATAVDMLLGNMASAGKAGRRFGMLLGVSCVTRYYTMSAGDRVEAELLDRMLPKDLPKFGYFGFGEICPTFDRAGKMRNGCHGQTVALCAF